MVMMMICLLLLWHSCPNFDRHPRHPDPAETRLVGVLLVSTFSQEMYARSFDDCDSFAFSHAPTRMPRNLPLKQRHRDRSIVVAVLVVSWKSD